MKKKGPYILITVLFGISLFILGVQYGKQIQIENLKVKEQISPQLSPNPTTQKALLEYKKYQNKDCSIAFSYPVDLKILKEKPRETTLTGVTPERYLLVSCAPNRSIEQPKKSATRSITLNDGTIPAYTYTITRDGIPLKVIDFSLTHPQKRTKIHIIIDERLYSLFINSFIYL